MGQHLASYVRSKNFLYKKVRRWLFIRMEDFGKEFFGIDESGYHESSYSGTLLFMGHLHSGDRKFGPGKMFI